MPVRRARSSVCQQTETRSFNAPRAHTHMRRSAGRRHNVGEGDAGARARIAERL